MLWKSKNDEELCLEAEREWFECDGKPTHDINAIEPVELHMMTLVVVEAMTLSMYFVEV